MPATTTLPRLAGGPLPLFAGLLRSESRKLHTVRSTFWALLVAVAFNVLTAGLLGALLPGHLSAHQKATINSVRVSLGGLHLSQVVIGLLGVLAVTSEYSSGMIRATLAAVPQRRLLLTAKALVFTATTAATGIAACLAAYLVFQAFLPPGDAMRTTLAGPGVLRAVTGPACTSQSWACSASASAPSCAPAPARWRSCSACCSCPPSWLRCCRHRGRTPSALTCR